MQPNQLFQQAQQLHQQGKLNEAEQLYRHVVEKAPHFAEAKHLLGIVCSQQGKHQEGVNWIRQAIQKQLAHPPYYNNLGLIYARMKDWENAKQAYLTATKFAPKFAEAWFNLGNVAKAQKKVEQAVKWYEKTIKVAPKHARAMYNLGNTLLENGKPKSARKWFEAAIKANPNYAEAHNNLGSALDAWNEYDLAFEHYKKAVELKPTFSDALKNLGNAYLRQGNYQKGRELINESIVKKDDTGWGDLLVTSLSPIIFEDNDAIDFFQKSVETKLEEYLSKQLRIDLPTLHDQRLEPSSNLPYQGRDVKKIKLLYGQLFDRYLPKITRPTFAFKAKPRIGFVVTNGHEGVFMKCMCGIVNQFDTERFDVTIVCSLPHGEEKLRPEITNPTVKFLGIPKRLDQALEVVAKANFDVLHYWEIGTDYQNYYLPFFGLASIQCATWGWPVTSGIPEMDYFLSCELLEIPEADEHYTENLVRFKKLPSYYYRPPVPEKLEPIESFGLPSNVPIYLCAQNLRKVHPDFDGLVKAILLQDSKGIIVFIEDAHSNITQLLQDRLEKVCAAYAVRIRFLERMSAERYLNLVACVDVILDTLYYTGGANTAYDAIAAGTPYVTLPWTYHRGKYGEAAYRQIGVTDAIAKNEADYVAKAVKIANDKNYRKELSERILEQAHKVFEDKEAVRELEDFFWAKTKTVRAMQ